MNCCLYIDQYTRSDISDRYINYKCDNMTTDTNNKCEAHGNPMSIICEKYI